MGIKLDRVININADPEILIERAVGRRICRECGATYHVKYNPPKVEGVCDKDGGELYQRDDDTEETVTTRINVYMEQTEPLIDYYKNQGLLLDVDGTKTIEEVFVDITSGLDK
jgi:adenylate kinase